MKKIFSFIAAVLFAGSMMADSYVKVTTAPADWSGDYLLVYETGNVAFNGALETFDASKNTIAVTITNGAIAATNATNAAKITIAAVEGGYSVKGASGKYLGATSYSNSLTTSDDAIVNTLSITNGNIAMVVSTSGGDVTMKFNDASNQMRFRYYKTGQKDVQLYKFTEGDETPVEPQPVVETPVVYNWANNAADQVGTTILGAAGVEISTVKIHENTDDVAGIKFGSSYVYADGKYIAVKPAEGAFKTGDTLKVSVVFNNSDETKYCMADVYAADGETRLFRSDSAKTINGRLSSGEPVVQDYVLASNQDSLILGRYGNTGMFITFLQVVRPAAEEPVVEGPKTCAEAAAAALSVSANNELYNDGAEYTIEGYVTSIASAYNSQYNNISFWMADEANGDNVIEAYRAACASAEDAPAVGDKVAVTGKLTKYGTTPEFAAGCTYVIKEKSQVVPQNLGAKTIAEFLALKNTVDTCVLTGVVTSITNTDYGNLYLADAADTLYVYGVLTSEGASKQFASLNVAAGDTLTVMAVYSEYNGAPQAKNAVFVSVKKQPAQTIDITIAEGVVFTDNVESDGWWQIIARNDEYLVSLSNAGLVSVVPGTYDVAALDAEYSYIEIRATEEEIAFVSGSVTLAVDANGVVTAVGSFVGSDGNTYNLNFTYVEPKVESTVNIVINDAALYDMYAEYGLMGVYGLDADSAYVQLAIFFEDSFEGDFTEEDLDYQYVGTGLVDAEGKSQMIYTAAINVVANADGSYTITADILCYNNVLYKVTMTVPAGSAVENVESSLKPVKVLNHDGQVLIIRDGKTYNVAGIRL